MQEVRGSTPLGSTRSFPPRTIYPPGATTTARGRHARRLGPRRRRRHDAPVLRPARADLERRRPLRLSPRAAEHERRVDRLLGDDRNRRRTRRLRHGTAHRLPDRGDPPSGASRRPDRADRKRLAHLAGRRPGPAGPARPGPRRPCGRDRGHVEPAPGRSNCARRMDHAERRSVGGRDAQGGRGAGPVRRAGHGHRPLLAAGRRPAGPRRPGAAQGAARGSRHLHADVDARHGSGAHHGQARLRLRDRHVGIDGSQAGHAGRGRGPRAGAAVASGSLLDRRLQRRRARHDRRSAARHA